MSEQGRRLLAGAALGAAIAVGAAHAEPLPPQVQVEHAAARLVVIAEPRANVSVSVVNGPSRLPPLAVRQEDGRVIVDGGLERPFGAGPGHVECRGGPPGQPSAQVTGVGLVAWRDLPVITAHVPLDARLSTAGAVYGQIGGSRSLQLANAGCGDWNVGPVQGQVSAALAGSGDVHAGDTGPLDLHVSGSGDLTARRIMGPANAVIVGSGDLRAASIAGSLNADVRGSGDITVEHVDGPVQARLSGSGDVKLKSGRAPVIDVRTSGSADFVFGGEAGRVQALASGSGDIHIAHASGPVSQSSSGSADISIGR